METATATTTTTTTTSASPLAVVAEWMPPAIDRLERRRCLDDEGAEAFERQYGCRLRSEVYQLWTSERHKRFPQRSQPWYDFRDHRLTASVVPAVLEYMTFPGESRRKKFLGYIGLGAPFVQNPACDWGTKYEDCGMAALERTLTTESHKSVFLPFDIIDSKNPLLAPYAYSPDGIGCDASVAECKAPWRRAIVPGLVKPNYQCQVQFGMHVIDGGGDATGGSIGGLFDLTYFFEYRPPQNQYLLESEILSVTEQRRDPDWPQKHVWLLEEFWSEVETYREQVKAHGFGTMPAHYRSEAAATVWYRKRVVADLSAPVRRFHDHQRVSINARKRKTASAAATSVADEEQELEDEEEEERRLLPGGDVEWASVASAASAASMSLSSFQPPPSAAAATTRPKAGSDISWVV